MKTSGITAALPAQDLGRAKAFDVEKVGLQALESGFLQARDGQVGLTVGDGVSQLFVYPARARSSGEFTHLLPAVQGGAGDLAVPDQEVGPGPAVGDQAVQRRGARAERREPGENLPLEVPLVV